MTIIQYPNFTGTSSIQDRHFASQEACSNLITGLSSARKKNDPNAIMTRSNEGVTGFTFLCTVPSSYIKGEHEINTIPTVLKWQDETLCKAEQLGAKIFRHLNFRTPLTYFFDAKNVAALQLMKSVAKQVPSMEALVGIISCLAMPRLFSNNLSHFIKTGAFFKLNETNQKRMIHEFGKIAAVDLLMGNDDRFIAFPSPSDKVIELPKGHINSGNILIHLLDDQLQGIFPIDNCPSTHLLKKERKSSGGVFEVADLFGAEFEETSTEEPSAETDKAEVFHQFFVDFYNNPEKIARQFTEAFLKEIQCPEKEIEKFDPMIKTAFLSGIQEQLSLLSEQTNSLCLEIEPLQSSDEGLSNAKRLLIQNVNFLKGKKHDSISV